MAAGHLMVIIVLDALQLLAATLVDIKRAMHGVIALQDVGAQVVVVQETITFAVTILKLQTHQLDSIPQIVDVNGL